MASKRTFGDKDGRAQLGSGAVAERDGDIPRKDTGLVVCRLGQAVSIACLILVSSVVRKY